MKTLEEIVSAFPNKIRCRLCKEGRVENPLFKTEMRLNAAEGVCENELPKAGAVFHMIAVSPNPDAHGRLVQTSTIQSVEKLDVKTFRLHTLNSIYTLELL